MELDAIYLGRMRFGGPEAANNWHAGLFQTLDKLKTFPTAYPLAPGSELLGGNARQTSYGKGTGAYRILFGVFKPTAIEPGIVRVMRIRHGSRRPLDEPGN